MQSQDTCKQCGFNTLEWDAAKGKQVCPQCKHEQEILKVSNQVREVGLAEGIRLFEIRKGLDMEAKEWVCGSCGAKTLASPQSVHIICTFCGSKKINEAAIDQKTIRPSGLIPFQIDKKQATKIFTEYTKVKDFTMEGIYIPMWTFDADTTTQYTVEVGREVTSTRRVKNSDGVYESQEYTYIDWYGKESGTYSQRFDDLIVPATNVIPIEAFNEILPFDWKSMVSYDPNYLSGWKTELYKHDITQSSQVAEECFRKEIIEGIWKQYMPTTTRDYQLETTTSNVTFKLVLVPVWHIQFPFEKRMQKALVNGQTGKLYTDSVMTTSEIILLFVCIFGLLGLVIYLIAEINNGKAWASYVFLGIFVAGCIAYGIHWWNSPEEGESQKKE